MTKQELRAEADRILKAFREVADEDWAAKAYWYDRLLAHNKVVASQPLPPGGKPCADTAWKMPVEGVDENPFRRTGSPSAP